jgi:hypothetical protein
LVEDVEVEPAEDVVEAFDAVGGFAAAGEFVGFAGEADEDGGDFEEFEGAEHLFAAGGGRGAEVGFGWRTVWPVVASFVSETDSARRELRATMKTEVDPRMGCGFHRPASQQGEEKP